jgi:ADP-heptose:LPS heptosyltransferase
MKKILVYRIGSIGDTLVALPSFWAIRKAFPNAHIAYFTNGDSDDPEKLIAKRLLPEGVFDEWLVYPNDFAKAAAGLILKLREKKFDSLFYLMTRNRGYYRVQRDILFFRLAGIKKIFGARYLLKNLLSMTPEKPVKAVDSELEFLLKCVYAENLDLPQIENFLPDLRLNEDEIDKADRWLQLNCSAARREKKLIAVMAGTNWSSKIWAPENYIEIVSRLIKEENVFPIVFGGKNDRELGNRFLKAWGTGANAAGELGIRGDAGLLRHCNLYLGTDTGTMHLAGSMGVPCVAVFAAIDYLGRWTPFGNGHRIFRERVECEGCFAPVCFNKHKCLNLISPESVYRACVAVLHNGSEK